MTSRQVFGAALLAWFVVGVMALASGPPLGHDEAAYAVAARGDGPAWAYRSTGMIEVARVGLFLGGSDPALRGVALLLNLCVLISVYFLGRAYDQGRCTVRQVRPANPSKSGRASGGGVQFVKFDPRAPAADGAGTGAWAAAVIATASPFAIHSAELIGDLAATAALVGGLAVLIGELERPAPRWRLLLAAPLFATAFYLRYGSAPVIALIAALAVVLYRTRLLRREVLATAALALLLVVPHFARALATTGSPLGILTVSAGMPRRAYVGEGLVSYLTADPVRMYGAVATPLLLAALASLAVAPRRRAQLFVIGVALGQLIALGLESHAQPRYVFCATALLVVAGVAAVRHWAGVAAVGRWAGVRAPRPRLAAATLGLAWLGLAIAIVPYQRWLAGQRAPLYAAAATVRADAAGRPCAIAANVAPQLIWITHCQVVIAKSLPQLPQPWPAGAIRYAVSAPHAQLSPALLDALAATAGTTGGTGAIARELPVASEEARVWRLDPGNPP